jgi:glycosyltransferase involved in cell wall biosynthesis
VSSRNKVSQVIDQYLERKVLGRANHITTVSSSIGNRLKRKLRCKDPGRKISIIPNGWDPDDFERNPKPDRIKFIILHTGNLNATQNPLPLLNSLQNLKKTNPDLMRDLKLKFIGSVQENIQKAVLEKDLQASTEMIPFLPHQEIIGEMQKASILFSVVPDVPDNKGIVMSKNFEYIGSGLPVLIIGPEDSDIAQIISQFSHSQMVGYDDTETCQSFILKSYQNWKQDVIPGSPSQFRELYSRLTLTGKLAEILDRLVDK